MLTAIPLGWPGLIGKGRSIFLRYFHMSLTGRLGIMESILYPSKIPEYSFPFAP